MTTVEQTDPRLNRIKESVKGKSPTELLQMRRDIAGHLRDLEPHLEGTEIAARFGTTGGMQSHEQQAARCRRHQAELAYLDSLLAADPAVLAQAQAE